LGILPPCRSAESCTVYRRALLARPQIRLSSLPCVVGQVRLNENVFGMPATAAPACACCPAPSNARPRPTCAEYFTRRLTVSVAEPTIASAVSNEESASLKASAPLSGVPRSGLPDERSANGWPLQKSSADCSSAYPFTNHISPISPFAAGLYVFSPWAA